MNSEFSSSKETIWTYEWLEVDWAVRRDARHSYFVVVLFDERAKSETEALVGPNRPVHCIDHPWRFVLVDFLALGLRIIS